MVFAWLARADQFLAKYRGDGGRIPYAELGQDPSLQEIMDGIASQDPKAFRDKSDSLAFYLNAYNLAALAIVARMVNRDADFLQHGLTRWRNRIRFFFLERVRVASRWRTLFGLEFLTIRRRHRDPRVHFALFCATGSCPPLKGGTYEADRLERDLEAAAKNFVRPSVGYSLDRERRVITFNPIFKWYRRDFRRLGGPIGVLETWGPGDDAQFVRVNRTRTKFAPYDWNLT